MFRVVSALCQTDLTAAQTNEELTVYHHSPIAEHGYRRLGDTMEHDSQPRHT